MYPGESHALYIPLLISKLFCAKGCMGGGGREYDVNSFRTAGGGVGVPLTCK
jgi:hypothetical protein